MHFVCVCLRLILHGRLVQAERVPQTGLVSEWGYAGKRRGTWDSLLAGSLPHGELWMLHLRLLQ